VALPPIAPAEPVPTYLEPPTTEGAHDHEEPPLPDEARARAVGVAGAATPPVEARPDQVLHVRFAASARDRLVAAMETFRALLRDRPGETRVVLHLPGTDGGAMELRRGVAYDAELLAEVRRRLGDGVVDLRLA
jgi:hypothetical protein